MSPGQLQDHLIATLVRQVGGAHRRWRELLGPVRVHDRATHPHCNWSLQPVGRPGEVATVEHLLDTIRLLHPFVTRD